LLPALVAWSTHAPVGLKHAVACAKNVATHDPAIGLPAQNSDEPSAAESVDEASGAEESADEPSDVLVSAGPSPPVGESLPPVPTSTTSAALAAASPASTVDPGAPLELPHPMIKSAETPGPLIPSS
jgi:hypothetical protein